MSARKTFIGMKGTTMYYTNKPIEKIVPALCENPSRERKNVLRGVAIHAIEEKTFFANPGERPHMNYDTDSTLLTDGVYSPDRNYPNPEWFHLHSGGGRVITFKLPYLYAVDSFLMSTCRDDVVGVRTPRYVKVRVSADGESFETVYEADTRSARDMRVIKIEGEFEPVQAVYVQFVVDAVHHVYIDEIELYGCTDVAGAKVPTADGKPIFNEFPGPSEVNEFPPEDVMGAHNILLTYNYRPVDEDLGLRTEADYFPLVAYLDREGNIKDTFMDGFLFLPDVSFDFSPRGQHAEGWQDYMDSVFVTGKNLDALNKTAKKVGTALGMPDYKVSVFFTILYTFTGYDDFGTVGGEHLVFDNPESRKKAIRWLVDYMIERYEAGAYGNTELKGFYWFEEALNPTDRYEEELIRYTCKYVQEKGYKCFWIPYFRALGYEHWQRYGFDIACMQPNYMFEDHIPKSRLYDTAAEAKRMGMCVELEVWKIKEDADGNIDNPGNIEKFIDYLEVGAETGYMNTSKMYYHGSRFRGTISNGWKSKNARYREMYDKTYLFAKKKLK